MSEMRRRVLRMLRSPRLAVALIGVLAVYTIVTTAVPRGARTDPSVSSWAAAHPVAEAVLGPLGFHAAYVSPFFLALVALLAASTAACAAQRTTYAIRHLRRGGSLPAAGVERLRTRPWLATPVPAGVDAEAVLSASEDGMRRLGFRVSRDGPLLEGSGGSIGLLGSPVFHWALVGLIVVAGLGQATRSEGEIALPVGDVVRVERASYLQLREGPLRRARDVGIELRATEVVRRHSAGGADVGFAPRVTALKEGAEVASGLVYPNSPLRVGSLLVGRSDFGPALTTALEASSGAEIARTTFLLKRSTASSTGTEPKEFALAGPDGAPAILVRVSMLERKGDQPASRALIETATPASRAFATPVVVREGEFLALPGGERLRVAHVTDWAGVLVVDDWSIPFIYALIAVITVGIGVSVLLRPRRLAVLLVEIPDGFALHAALWHSRPDPLLERDVQRMLARSATGKVEE